MIRKQLIFIVMFLFAGSVFAQKRGYTFGGMGLMGLGGEAETKVKQGGQTAAKGSDDFTTNFGLSVFGFARIKSKMLNSYPGLEMRLLWINTENNDDAGNSSHTLLEIAPNLKFKTKPMAPQLKFYLRLAPIGLSIFFPTDDWDTGGRKFKTAIGFNISGYVGAEYALSPNMALLFELGYLYHWVKGDIKFEDGSKAKYYLYGGQLHLNVGLRF